MLYTACMDEPSSKSNWNVFIGVCVGAVLGFAVGQHMGAKGPLGTPIKGAQAHDPVAAGYADAVRVGGRVPIGCAGGVGVPQPMGPSMLGSR